MPATKLLGRSPIPTFQVLHSAILAPGLQTTCLPGCLVPGSVRQRGLWSGCWRREELLLVCTPERFASTSCSWDPHSTRLLHPGSGSLLPLGAVKSSCFLLLFPTLTEPASSGHLRHQHQQSRPFLRRMGFSSMTPPPNVSILISVLLTLSL